MGPTNILRLKRQVHGQSSRLLVFLISLSVRSSSLLMGLFFIVAQASAAAAVSLAASASRMRVHEARSPRRRSPSPTARTCSDVRKRRAGSAEGRSALAVPSSHLVSKVSWNSYKLLLAWYFQIYVFVYFHVLTAYPKGSQLCAAPILGMEGLQELVAGFRFVQYPTTTKKHQTGTFYCKAALRCFGLKDRKR